MIREIDRRIRRLEAVNANTEDVFVTVVLDDGSQKKMLWADAMLLETGVKDVQGSCELADLVRIFLFDDVRDSIKR